MSWEWVVEPTKYKDLSFVDENLLAAQNDDGKYSVIDTHDNIVISAKYDSISEFHDEIAKVESNGNSFYIDKSGNLITDEMFQEVNGFSESLGGVKKNGLWGFINTLGEVVIAYQFDDIALFSEQRAAVKVGEKWGFVDNLGKVIAEYQYDDVKSFSEGYAAIMKNDKWGFIDKEGKEFIDLKYDAVGDFSEGKASVQIINYKEHMDAWAYIDKKDNVVIDFYPYDAAEGRMIWTGKFKDGIAFVSKTLYCIIDDKGNDIFAGDSIFFISGLEYNSEYDAIPAYVYTDEKMTIQKYGLMGIKGNQRLEPVFDYIYGIKGNILIVEKIIDGEYKKGIIRLPEPSERN